MFIEYLYADQVINDYSRMNNMVFSLPVLFLCLAYVCVAVWRMRILFWRAIIMMGIAVFVFYNTVTVRDYLWRYTEVDWAYNDLKNTAILIPHYAQGQPYDLSVYRYNEGSYESVNVYDMLYFIELYPAHMPETFNGVTHWGVTHEPLEGKNAHQRIIVIDKKYVGYRDLPKNAILVAKTIGYDMYRIVY
jgi:hypothetical protein